MEQQSAWYARPSGNYTLPCKESCKKCSPAIVSPGLYSEPEAWTMKGSVFKGWDVAPWFGRCFTHASPGAPSGKLETGLESKLRRDITITVRGRAWTVQRVFVYTAIIQILWKCQFLSSAECFRMCLWDNKFSRERIHLMNATACSVAAAL